MITRKAIGGSNSNQFGQKSDGEGSQGLPSRKEGIAQQILKTAGQTGYKRQ
jgi:hypothetical protein